MPEFFSRTTREKVAVLLPYLHIFVLTGFSLAQPLFDLLSRNAEFFVVHYAQPIDILLLIGLLSALVPLLAIGFELLVKPITRGHKECCICSWSVSSQHFSSFTLCET